MKKFEIVNNSLVVTDTVTNKILFDNPKSEIYYNSGFLFLNPSEIRIIDFNSNYIYSCLLSEAVNSLSVAFTQETFIDFARRNLGFKTASGGSDAIVYLSENYSALILEDTAYLKIGDLSYVYNSQGTSWLPGTIGGTYYPSGFYFWNGTNWESDRNAIANQFNTNILDIVNLQNNKQDNLVSGTNIKTLGGQSILGNGNIDLTKTDVGLANVDNTSDLGKPISTSTQTALNGKANQDGTILYHTVKWFTPSNNVSNVGATVTSVSAQFTSAMLGAKLIINGEQRIITAFTSTTVVIVNSAYSVNNTNITPSNWGVYSMAYALISGNDSNVFFNTGGTKILYIDVNGNYVTASLYGVFNRISANRFAININGGVFMPNNGTFIFSSTTNAESGPADLGFRRNSAGVLEIYDGITATGLLANRRDLLIRNLVASAIQLTARTIATATTAGNAGEICWDANYIYVCTATNTWKRTALTTW